MALEMKFLLPIYTQRLDELNEAFAYSSHLATGGPPVHGTHWYMACPKIEPVVMNKCLFSIETSPSLHQFSRYHRNLKVPRLQCLFPGRNIRPFLVDYQPQSSFNNPLIRPYFFGWVALGGWAPWIPWKHHLCPTWSFILPQNDGTWNLNITLLKRNIFQRPPFWGFQGWRELMIILIMQWNTFEQQTHATICLMTRNMTRESLRLKYCNIKIYFAFWIDVQYIPLIARYFVATKTKHKKQRKRRRWFLGFYPLPLRLAWSMFCVKRVHNILGHQKHVFSKWWQLKYFFSTPTWGNDPFWRAPHIFRHGLKPLYNLSF